MILKKKFKEMFFFSKIFSLLIKSIFLTETSIFFIFERIFFYQENKMHSLASLFMTTLIAYSIKSITMNHDNACTCDSGICTYTTNQLCACATGFLTKYSPRTSFPITCSTTNDVSFKK